MRRLLISTIAATVVATAACGGDSATGPAAVSVAGTYGLKTINSAALPYTMPDDGSGLGPVMILSDSYTLSDDSKYTGVTRVRITSAGVPSDMSLSSSGTYVRAGNTISLTDSQDPTDKVTGTLSGSTLTINVDGFVLVYQRSGS